MPELNTPTVTQQILIETRVANEKKNVLAAYFLFLIFFPFGAADFYVGRKAVGFAILGCSVALVFLYVTSVSMFFSARFDIVPMPVLSILGVVLVYFWFYDLFTLPGAVLEDTQRIRNRLFRQYGFVESAASAQVTLPEMSNMVVDPIEAVKRELPTK